MPSRARKDHNLAVSWDVHPQAALRGDAEALSRRGIADLALESRALALQLRPFYVELRQGLRLPDADRPSPHDCQRD